MHRSKPWVEQGGYLSCGTGVATGFFATAYLKPSNSNADIQLTYFLPSGVMWPAAWKNLMLHTAGAFTSTGFNSASYSDNSLMYKIAHKWHCSGYGNPG